MNVWERLVESLILLKYDERESGEGNQEQKKKVLEAHLGTLLVLMGLARVDVESMPREV